MFNPQPGDILFYEVPDTLPEMLIEDGERLADGDSKGGRYVYHCALAINPYQQVEALWHVKINPVSLNNAIVCRPTYPDHLQLWGALGWGRRMQGHLYGLFGITDQILRKASGNRLHFPLLIVKWANNRWPYCSTLVAGVLQRAGVNVKVNPPDPQQLYDQFKVNTVYDWRENV